MKTSLIAAVTLCGRIGPLSPGSPEDRRFLENMRRESQAGVIGAGTLRQGEVEMRGPGGVWPAGRLRVLVSASGDLPEQRKIFHQGPPPLIITGPDGGRRLQQTLAAKAELLVVPQHDGELALAAAWAQLAARGVKHLLVEGGGALNYQVLRQGLADELLLTITPRLHGQRGAPALADGPAPLALPFLELDLLDHQLGGSGELFCRYRIRNR